MRTAELPIDNIEVGFRYPRNLGDLWSLADSIAVVGLLHLVVVTPEGSLIAGQRRREACRLLGWTEEPVTVGLCQAARG
jgi:ParB-like chromosome segregation protein Spo0J